MEAAAQHILTATAALWGLNMGAVFDFPPPELTEAELERITRYKRPSKQMEILKSLGIPARLRCDNTVLVLRMHLLSKEAAEAANVPIKRPPRVK